MILKVARLGFPSLRTASSAVPADRIKTKEFQQLIDDMTETMYEYNGVGLAAPQVHLPIQLAVLEVHNHPRYPEMPDVPLTVLINPVVTILDKSLSKIGRDVSACPNFAAAFRDSSSCA